MKRRSGRVAMLTFHPSSGVRHDRLGLQQAQPGFQSPPRPRIFALP